MPSAARVVQVQSAKQSRWECTIPDPSISNGFSGALDSCAWQRTMQTDTTLHVSVFANRRHPIHETFFQGTCFSEACRQWHFYEGERNGNQKYSYFFRDILKRFIQVVECSCAERPSIQNINERGTVFTETRRKETGLTQGYFVQYGEPYYLICNNDRHMYSSLSLNRKPE